MKDIINSMQYQDLLNSVQEISKIKILDEYGYLLASRDEQNMKLANLSKEKLIKLIEIDKDLIIRFAIYKIDKFRNTKIDQEYPKGEEVEKENDNEKVLGYSRRFLLMYIIEYYLLKSNPSELKRYLKAIRIPYASKYEKELKELYSKL